MVFEGITRFRRRAMTILLLSVEQPENIYKIERGMSRRKRSFFKNLMGTFNKSFWFRGPGRADFPAREIMIKSLTGLAFSWYLSSAICMGLEIKFY